MSTTPTPPSTWEDVLAAITAACDTTEHSDAHARIAIPLPAGTTHPVMVWHGQSASSGREVIHVAAPIRHTDDTLSDIAGHIDEFPAGSLRLLGELPHIHEALPLGALRTDAILGVIKLIATEAASLENSATEGEAA